MNFISYSVQETTLAGAQAKVKPYRLLMPGEGHEVDGLTKW